MGIFFEMGERLMEQCCVEVEVEYGRGRGNFWWRDEMH